MGFRDQIKEADARRQSEYFAPGTYLVKVTNFCEGATRKGRDFVVVETQVLDSDNLEAHPKGSERTWMQMTDLDTAAQNIRGFLCRALNVANSALTDEMVDNAFEADDETGVSPLAGLKVGVRARELITKKGNPFTLCDFFSVDQEKDTL